MLFSALLACFLHLTTSMEAALIFAGEDVGTSSPADAGRKRFLTELTNCAITFANFRSSLSGIAVESFENYSVTQVLTHIHFGTNTAQITGGIVLRPAGDSGHVSGQFALSGEQFLGTTTPITVRFSAPQPAFGFFLTDVETLSRDVVQIDASGARKTNTVPARLPQGSGGCVFYGIIDRDKPFVAIEISGAGTEGYGFDDMMIEDVEPIGVPASIAIESYAGIQIVGTPQARYRIEVSPTAQFTSWETQKTIQLPSSPFVYFDEQPVKGHNRRFYRAVAQ